LVDHDYYALATSVAAHDQPHVLHLVRDDAEAALCGVPRRTLGVRTVPEGLVCDVCVEWLWRRRSVSAATKRVEP
jgi:hypothetical protein